MWCTSSEVWKPCTKEESNTAWLYMFVEPEGKWKSTSYPYARVLGKTEKFKYWYKGGTVGQNLADR